MTARMSPRRFAFSAQARRAVHRSAPGLSADDVLARMEKISFQGRNLGAARRIWEKMLASDATIFLGTAGALSAGGMRLILAHLIEHRYIDCLVSTGANLYHDLHETRGRRHFIGIADARRRRACRGANRSRLRHAGERRRVLQERRVDCRLRAQARTPSVHHARIPLQARRAPVAGDRAPRHPDRGLSGERADLLSRHRGLVDRHGRVTGASSRPDGRA